jgi:hypothetical protein
MTLDTLNSIFASTAIIAAVLAAIAAVGSWWTGSIIDARKQQEIAGLHATVGTLQPRMITAPQREKLIPRLSDYKQMKVGFAAKIFDPEAKNFAEQLASVFKQAGWTIVDPINAQLLDDYDGYINIVAVSTGTADRDKQLTATADKLIAEIGDADIPCRLHPVREGGIGGTLEPGSIYLLIGSRPPHTQEHG